MPEKKTSRKLALAAGLVAAFGLTMAASAPQPAEAVAAAQDCYYFSDSSHSQPVGARGKDCCGRSIDWGTTSSFFYCEPVPVCVWCPPESEVS